MRNEPGFFRGKDGHIYEVLSRVNQRMARRLGRAASHFGSALTFEPRLRSVQTRLQAAFDHAGLRQARAREQLRGERRLPDAPPRSAPRAARAAGRRTLRHRGPLPARAERRVLRALPARSLRAERGDRRAGSARLGVLDHA